MTGTERTPVERQLTVGELAERTAVSTSALRFYERQGLLYSTRNGKGERRYTEDAVRRVAFIRASQSLGIALSMIKRGLDLFPDGRSPTPEDWERAGQCWADDLDNRIALIRELRDSLTDCIGCGCLSLRRCKIMNPGDELSALGPGPRRLVQ